MALKYISELTMTNNIDDTDLLVIDDGSKNYAIRWSTLKAALATVSGFTVNNTNGTITITLSTGAELTVTPHDPTKQDVLTFDSTPTQNSDNPVKSGGVFAALLTKLNSTDYVNFTGATDQAAGAAGKVPAPAAGGSRYLASTGNWETPDSTPTQNSAKLITSDAVYAALTDYLQKTGDGSDVTVAFTQASTRTNISTGEKLSVLFGKVKKWLADLGTAAFRSATSSITQNSTDLVESGAVHTGLASKVAYSDISDEYDPNATYEVGDLCIHENALYKCSTAISTAEAWTAAHWTAIALDEVMLKTSDVVNNLTIDDATGEKVAGQHEVYELNALLGSKSTIVNSYGLSNGETKTITVTRVRGILLVGIGTGAKTANVYPVAYLCNNNWVNIAAMVTLPSTVTIAQGSAVKTFTISTTATYGCFVDVIEF